MSSNEFLELAVIVVNYGSHQLLQSNIALLSRQVPEVAVTIVDNYSGNAERTAVTQLSASMGWALATPSANLGFGAGMNLGVKIAAAAGAKYFLLLNPDASIDRQSLSLLTDAVRREPSTMFAPRIMRPNGTIWFNGSDLYLNRGDTYSPSKRGTHSGHFRPWLTGACLLISEDLWERTGGFNERYFLYWEDVDLSFRVIAAGGQLTVLSEATAMHDEGGTHSGPPQQSRAKSALYYYYNIRNRLIFAALNLPAEDFRRWRRSSISASYNILMRGGRRQFLQPMTAIKITVAASRGIWDGLRMSTRVVAADSSPSNS